MNVEERVKRLEAAVKEQEAQRDWLRSVEWSDNHGTVEQAVAGNERAIETYRSLIARLKNQS